MIGSFLVILSVYLSFKIPDPTWIVFPTAIIVGLG
jgi:hypothetical protein